MTRNGSVSNPAAAFQQSGAGGGHSGMAGAGVDAAAPLQTLEARFPGGRLSAEQYLALDELADQGAPDALTIRPDLGIAVRTAGGEGLAARLAALEAGSSAGRPVPPHTDDETSGMRPQGDGYWSILVAVPQGCIADTADAPLRTALREVIGRWRPLPVLTAHGNMVLANIDPESVLDVEAELRARGVSIDRNAADILPQT